MKSFFQIHFLVIVPLLFLVAGCGGEKGPKVYFVTGTVYLDDAPLSDCRVIFNSVTSSEGTDATGRTDENGVYKIQTSTGKVDGGTTPGDYVVTFSKMNDIWDGRSYRMSGERNDERKPDTRSVEELPQQYTRSSYSQEKATVTKDVKSNVFDFHLKSKP